MTEQFEVIEKTFGPVIEIEERVSLLAMPSTFGRDFKQIMDYLQSQGARCVDMPYARYPGMDWDKELNRGKLGVFFSTLFKKWHFFAGMPTSTVLQGDGRLVSRVFGSQRYARGVHRGPYRNCGVTYKALHEWTVAQGLTMASEAIECYVNDPKEVGQDGLETVLLIPLNKGC